MYHQHEQHERRSNVYPPDHSFQQHSHSNRRPARGRGYGILRESQHLGGYNDEARFPARSRGPVLNHGRNWNSDRNASEYHHRASGSNHRFQRGYSASPTSHYHHPHMMDRTSRPSSAFVAQLNERVRLQIGNQSYQVERSYARSDQFDWSGFQQAASGFISFEDGHPRQGHQSNHTRVNINPAGGTNNSGPYYVDTDPERNHTETEDFIPFEDDSKSTEVSTVNDPEVLKVEEAGAQNFNISDEISCDDSEDEEVVFIGETVRSNSQVPIELDGPAQAAILPPASYNESFMRHIDSEEHQEMLNMLEESNKIRIQLLRFEAKRLQRIRSSESRGGSEQRHACTLCAVAYNGNVEDHHSCSVHRKLQDLLRPFCRVCKMEFSTAIERESHRLTVKHLQAKEKADETALAEVLEKTCVEVVNLDDRHDENSNLIDLEVVQENQSLHGTFANSSKSFNETQRTAESFPISADKTFEDQLIQSYLEKAPDIEAVKALFCSTCREYFAFEENAFHIHRQSARHLKGTQTSTGNSYGWNELQVARNDESSPASIGAPNTTQSPQSCPQTNQTNVLVSAPAERTASSPVKQIPNASSELVISSSVCEPSTSSATTESAESIAAVSSEPTLHFAPVITNTFSLASLPGDPSMENSASSGTQSRVADSDPAPTSTTPVPVLVPIAPLLMSINPESDVVENSAPDLENPAPQPSNPSVAVASNIEEAPLLDEKAVVAKPVTPTTPNTLNPATVSALPGSADGTGAKTSTTTTKPSTPSKFHIDNFLADPYEQLLKEGQMFKTIIKRIRAGVKVMVVLRGIPGSGKSHLANRLKGQGVVVSYDDYLTDDGKYIWNEVSALHALSMALKEVLAAAKAGKLPIIVDGHNLTSNELSHYGKVARAHKYKYFIVEPNTPWKYDIKMCARKNVHGLSFDQISKIARPFVDARMKKVAIKEARKTAKKRQAQNQSAGNGQVSKKGKRPRTLNPQAQKQVATNDAHEPPIKKTRR